MYETSRYSRRKVLAALGLTLPSVTVFVAACSAPAKPAAPAPTATPEKLTANSVTIDEAPSGPKVGGELRIDVQADPLSLDPIFRNAVEGQRIYRLTNNQLLKYKEDKTLEPDLAAALPNVSADGLTYTVKLKTGVKWHDGKPFEAADVKYTFEQILKQENQSVWATALTFVETVDAPDPQTFVVKLKTPYTAMAHKLALIPIISSKIPYDRDKTYAAQIVGTGPFKFIEWKRGQQIVLERNAEYFVQGRPYLTKLMINTVQDNAARVANAAKNSNFVMPDAPQKQADALRQSGATVTVLEQSTHRVFAYPSLQEGRPTRDVNIRLAIAWAIDRKAVVDQVFAGAAVPASTYLSSGSLYFDERLGKAFGDKPNVAKAQELLTKAGGPPKRELEIVVQNIPENVDVATIIQTNLKAIGITAKISQEEIASFLPRLLSGDYDLLVTRAPAGTTAGFGPDYPYLGLLSGSASNFNKFADPKMDDLLKKAVAAPEPQASAAWQAVQEYDLQTVGQIQIVTARYVEAYGKNLQGYKPSPLFMLHGLVDAYLT